jgi:hypothetical protein
MGTILIILGELEYLGGLVKLARKNKDVEVAHTHVIVVMETHIIRQLYINKTNHNTNLHLMVEIN